MPLSYPNFRTPTGQFVIPAGTKAFSVSVVSGSAYINDTLWLAGADLNWGTPDSKFLLGAPIVVGASGVANKVNVFWMA